MQWKIQAGNLITNHKSKVNFCLLEFSATKYLTWDFPMNVYTESR